MAVLSAESDFDPLLQPRWSVFTVSATASSLLMYDARRMQGFQGQFSYPDSTHVKGTVTEMSLFTTGADGYASAEGYKLTGIRMDAAVVQTKVVSGSGLFEYLLSGDDTISGGLRMMGFAGNDQLRVSGATVVDGGSGVDTAAFSSAVTANLLAKRISYASGGSATLSNVEHLRGSNYADVLTGNAGNNTLDGSGGSDTVSYAGASQAMSVNLATGSGGGTGHGSDTLVSIENAVGGRAADVLIGSDAANRLDGGAGADTLKGGLGNDIYVIDSLSDLITEASTGGVDTVEVGFNYTLKSATLENVLLVGSATQATGHSGANRLTGNSLSNLLNGAAGNDTLVGEAGNDTLNGGLGADSMQGGTGNDSYLVDDSGDRISESAGAGTDTVTSSVNLTLGANLERLVLTGSSALKGTGNELKNDLTGNSGNNVLDGRYGADTLRGGAGNDTYLVDNAYEVVVEASGAGHDRIIASVTYTLDSQVEDLTLSGTEALTGKGNSLDNLITGNAEDNTLDGATGSDTLVGGGGNDRYLVDRTTDVVTELSGQGTDTVQASCSYVLGANVERLTLAGTAHLDGTGNSAANYLTGNAGNNRLDGGAGADTLSGGAGNDTYVVNSSSDQVDEYNPWDSSPSGIDTVEASVSWTLGAEVEHLVLTGSADLMGTGNELDNRLTGNAGANHLVGDWGNDTLLGGDGVDTLEGGYGEDTFVIDSLTAADVITDLWSGEDRLLLDLSLALGDGDLALEDCVSVSGPGGFATTAELVSVSTPLEDGISAATAAQAIGQASSSYTTGQTALFQVSSDLGGAALYLFRSNGEDAIVSASELTCLVWLDNGPVWPSAIDLG